MTESPYHGHRFPAEAISCAARWASAQLSLRDIDELLFERGVTRPSRSNLAVAQMRSVNREKSTTLDSHRSTILMTDQ